LVYKFLGDNTSKETKMSNDSPTKLVSIEPSSPQKSRTNEKDLPPTLAYTISPQPQIHQSLISNPSMLPMQGQNIPFFNPKVPPPSIVNSYGNQLQQDFQLNPNCKPFNLNSNVNMYKQNNVHQSFAPVKSTDNTTHVIQSDKSTIQIKESDIFKEEYDKIDMRNDVIMAGEEIKETSKISRSSKQNEKYESSLEELARKQEFQNNILNTKRFESELEKIEKKFKEEKGYKNEISNINKYKIVKNEENPTLFVSRPFLPFQNLPIQSTSSNGQFQNPRMIYQHSQNNLSQRLVNSFRSPFTEEVVKFMSLLFPETYKELIDSLNKELQNHCDGSQLAMIELETNKCITLVIKNAPGVRPSKKYIEVKCYKPYEPQPILQLILSKEVETGTNFATLKDCQDIILCVANSVNNEMLKGTLIFPAYE